MKEFLDHFAATLGTATVALLLFSVCHEYGYFWIVGSHFQTFASTSDYFTNATQWIAFSLLFLWSWVDWKATFGLTSYYAPLSKDWRSWIFPVVVVVPFLYLDFFTSASFEIGAFFIFSYLWLVYGVKRVPFAEVNEPLYQRIRAVVIATPVLAVLAFVAGQIRGSSALATTSEPYKVKLKGGEERNRILLRSFEKGLLVRSPAHERVEFIKWDQLEEVTKSSPKARGEAYSCVWFQISCSKPLIVP